MRPNERLTESRKGTESPSNVIKGNSQINLNIIMLQHGTSDVKVNLQNCNSVAPRSFSYIAILSRKKEERKVEIDLCVVQII